MTTNNMVISIKTDEVTYTVDLNHSDCGIDEMITTYRGLLVQAGYHPQTVDQYFNTPAGEWFPEVVRSEHNQTS
jgi:hypothetical protein